MHYLEGDRAEGNTRSWLRWYDSSGRWILTISEAERSNAEAERSIAEAEQQRAEQAIAQLRQVVMNLMRNGMPTEQIAEITGLAIAKLEEIKGLPSA